MGVRVEALGTSLLSGSSPLIQVRAYGSWQKNDLVDRLPPYLVPSVLPSNATVSTVIAPDYRTLGIGGLVRTGQSESRPQAFIDGWAGAAWPDRQYRHSGARRCEHAHLRRRRAGSRGVLYECAGSSARRVVPRHRAAVPTAILNG